MKNRHKKTRRLRTTTQNTLINRRERRTAGNGQDATENTRKLKAVFRSGISRWIPRTSSAFQQDPSGNHRKKSGKFPTGILLPCSRYFACFPAGASDFPASFLEDPARSSGRNDRPLKYKQKFYFIIFKTNYFL